MTTNFPLINTTKSITVVENVISATGFFDRLKGLLGKSELDSNSSLWIHNCKSIHTWFMKFPIDAVFVDKNLEVKAIHKDIQPGRLIMPIWNAQSVFEFSVGAADRGKIEVGDKLNVGH